MPQLETGLALDWGWNKKGLVPLIQQLLTWAACWHPSVILKVTVSRPLTAGCLGSRPWHR